MKIHNLKRVTKNRKTQIIGRGGKRGKTSETDLIRNKAGSMEILCSK